MRSVLPTLFPLLLLLFSCSPSASLDGHQHFAEWLPRHSQSEGGLVLLDRRALAEGEVLLFRTKKSRHRAIAVMGSQFTASKFADALTFKEWLRKVYAEEKALKVSVRTTEVVRPVLQHLYATRTHFHAPIIVHANTFVGDGQSRERPVDAVHFVDSVRSLLPDGVISLGWTPSDDFSAVNQLDWAKAFQLIALLHSVGKQPSLLNMRLNDAVHSAEVLEWLLGVDRPAIYLVLKGDVDDFVDSDSPLQRLAHLSASARRRLLFDVDEKWRSRIRRFAPIGEERLENTVSVEPSRWLNWLFPSSFPMLSTSVLSPSGVAFLGWPNSLLLSTRHSVPFPARQTISGSVMFLPKRESREVIPQRKSGMILYLFDFDPDLLYFPRVPNAIQAFISFDGRISLENNEPIKRSYPKSSSAQLPRWPCYAFTVLDKGWRVEMEVWTERCSPHEDDSEEGEWVSQRTFLQLDTPLARNRRTRNVAIGKSGDGAIDFLTRSLEHNGSPAVKLAVFAKLGIGITALLLPMLITLGMVSHF